MAPPKGNANAVRHGLTCGKLPKRSGYVRYLTDRFRLAVEAEVRDRTGELGLHAAAVTQTACRWERHALLAQRWLRDECEKMTPEQRLAFSRDIARASAERDKCLRELGLHIRERDTLLATLYSAEEPPALAQSDADDDEPISEPSPVRARPERSCATENCTDNDRTAQTGSEPVGDVLAGSPVSLKT